MVRGISWKTCRRLLPCLLWLANVPVFALYTNGTSSSLSPTSFTTYTTVCTENGTTILHTHSKPLSGNLVSASSAKASSAGGSVSPSSTLTSTVTVTPSSTTTLQSSYNTSAKNTTETLLSQVRNSTSTTGLGDYVAAGLGLGTTTLISTVTRAPSTLRVTLPVSSIVALNSTPRYNSTSFALATGLSTAIPTSISNSSSSNFTWTGDCWDQWNEYWSASVFDMNLWYSEMTYVATTTIDTLNTVTSTYSGTYTVTEAQTHTEVSYNGAYPVATSIITSVNTATGTETDSPLTVTFREGEGNTTFLTTETITSTRRLGTPTGGVMQPGCVLPSVVPQCQSQWDAWLNGSYNEVLPFTCSQANSAACASASSSWESGINSFEATIDPVMYNNGAPTPICTQASVANSACSTLVSSFLAPPEAAGGLNFEHRSISPWPSASTLAPGCTLGCQTCAITGRAVQLFYWPPATANGSATHASGVVLETAANGSQPLVTAVTSGMTFTSPTVYVSYDLLYASDSCSGIGKTYSDTILPLSNTADLSSLSFYAGDQDWQPYYSTRPFNLNDLIAPIPESIYDQDPRCQASKQLWADEEGNLNKTFSCPRTAAYAPIIAVPTEVMNLDPEWKSCTAWYGGLYDPPKALRPATAAVSVTVPDSQPTTTPASPSSTRTSIPAQTIVAVTKQTSAAQASAGSGDSAATSNGVDQTASTEGQGNGDSTTAANAESKTIGSSQQAVTTASAPTTSANGQSIEIASTADSTSDGSNAQTGLAASETYAPGAGTRKDSSVAQAATTQAQSSDDLAGQIASLLAGTSGSSAASSNNQAQSTEAQSSADPAGQLASLLGEETSTASPAGDGGASTAVTTNEGTVASAGNTAEGAQPTQQPTTSGDPSSVNDPSDPNQGVAAGTTNDAGSGSTAGSAQANTDPSDPASSQVVTNAAPTQLVSIASQTLTVVQPSEGVTSAAAVVNGNTIFSGQEATTISGIKVSPGNSGVVVGSSTIFHLQPSPASGASDPGSTMGVAASEHTLTATQASSGALVLGGQTVSADGVAVTYQGATISATSNGIQVNGAEASTLPVASASRADAETVVTMNGQTLVATRLAGQTGNVVAIGGTTVAQGGAGAVVDGQSISAVSNGLLIGGTTVPLTTPAPSASNAGTQLITANGQVLTVVSVAGQTGNAIAVNGVTLSNGGVAATIDGASLSAVTGGLVIDGTITKLSPQSSDVASAQETVLAVNGHTLTASVVSGPSGNAVVVNGQTISQGGAVGTAAGATVSAVSNGLVIDGTTVSLSEPTAVAASVQETMLSIDGHTLTASVVSQESGNAIVVDGQTISQGGAAISEQGMVVSAASDGLVVGSSTVLLSEPTGNLASAQETVLAMDSHTLTAVVVPQQSGNVIIVNGQTVSQGGAAVSEGGIIVSAATNGLVVDGSTVLLSEPTAAAASAQQTLLTIDGHTLTASSLPGQSGLVVINGETITSGGVVATLDGLAISGAANGGLVIDGSTTDIFPASTTSALDTIVTFDGHTLTASAVAEPTGNAIVVNGITLSSGDSAATYDGMTVSDGQGGLVVVAGGSKTTIAVSAIGKSSASAGSFGSSHHVASAAATGSSSSSATSASTTWKAMYAGQLMLLTTVVCLLLM